MYAFNNLLVDSETEFKVVDRTASYTALDGLTTVWTGLPGFMHADYYTNFFGPAPEHIWGRYTAAELLTAEESNLKPVGWGAYMFGEWVQGDSITLHKNPNYFRAAEGLPKFDRVIFRFVGQNTNANLAALLSGECDILDQSTSLGDQSQLLLDLQAAGQIKATFTTGAFGRPSTSVSSMSITMMVSRWMSIARTTSATCAPARLSPIAWTARRWLTKSSSASPS